MQSRQTARGMWVEALDLLDRADRLHRQFFHLGGRTAGPPSWEPPVDVYESHGEIWLYYALPGVRAERVKVQLDGAMLVVHGERPLPAQARHASIRRLEIPYGPFERRMPLPAGRYELLERQLESGCLVIGLRRVG